MTTVRKRGREAKRAEVVNLALELFSRKGCDRTSFREMSAASLVIAATDGLLLQWLLDPDQVDMGRMLEQLTIAQRGASS